METYCLSDFEKKLTEGELKIDGSLNLSWTSIASLPEGLVVGGSPDLSGTAITSLPKGLAVGGSLYLSGTAITSLPEGLTVGGCLYLNGTAITSLPEGLTVGGIVLHDNIHDFEYYRLKNGDYAEGRYIYADWILTHIKRKKHIGKYEYYIGKISGKNVIFDGQYYAHCKNFKAGVRDLEFKRQRIGELNSTGA